MSKYGKLQTTEYHLKATPSVTHPSDQRWTLTFSPRPASLQKRMPWSSSRRPRLSRRPKLSRRPRNVCPLCQIAEWSSSGRSRTWKRSSSSRKGSSRIASPSNLFGLTVNHSNLVSAPPKFPTEVWVWNVTSARQARGPLMHRLRSRLCGQRWMPSSMMDNHSRSTRGKWFKSFAPSKATLVLKRWPSLSIWLFAEWLLSESLIEHFVNDP